MKLDFLIIGAQKSATTALFKYLQPHSELALPAAKEVPLFTQDVVKEEVDNFVRDNYASETGKLLGKATPQYMCDERIPARIHDHNPDMKLIAVLRDPIDRAWSHYRMNLRRETEGRSFEQAMIEQLNPKRINKARVGSPPLHTQEFENEGDYYLVWGEYGRILKQYLELFRREQLLVLHTSELKNDPSAVLDRVLDFLGLETGFRPDCLGEVVHKGGSNKIISTNTRHKIRDIWPVKAVWSLVPEHKKQELRYWFEQLNVRSGDETMVLSDRTYQHLASHFAKDAALLSEITGTSPDWYDKICELRN